MLKTGPAMWIDQGIDWKNKYYRPTTTMPCPIRWGCLYRLDGANKHHMVEKISKGNSSRFRGLLFYYVYSSNCSRMNGLSQMCFSCRVWLELSSNLCFHCVDYLAIPALNISKS